MTDSSTLKDAISENELALSRQADREMFPLSFNQQDMWFQNRIHPENGLNNIGVTVTLEGPFRRDLFHQALQAVVNRHEVLRTVFLERDGVPYQQVLPELRVDLPMLEIFGRSHLQRAAALSERECELVSPPFDLGRGPLFRAELLGFGEEDHVCILVYCHLVLDGISMAQIFEQIAAAYEMLVNGGSATLPPFDIQFPDFAAWQHQRLQRGLLTRNQAYWRQQLADPLPAMNLPTDKDPRLVRSFAVDTLAWEVPAQVLQSFRGFRKRYRTTMFRIILAAFEVLLHRIVDEKELLLGIPFSTLPAQVSQLLGFFAHEVPIRVALHDDQPFTDVLSDVNRQLGEAQENVEYPLYEAVRESKINRDPYVPLFPVIITQPRKLNLAVGNLHLRIDSSKIFAGVYHLWLAALETRNGLTLGLHYNRQLLAGRPIKLIADGLAAILCQVAETPEARVSEFEILPEAERACVLGFNRQDVQEAEGLWVEECIVERSRETPERLAVGDRKSELTYAALNERANRMANWLRSAGVGREDRVGICGRREVGMLVAILGVIKAGAAFVPLDPNDPKERLRGIVSAAGLKWLGVDSDVARRGKELVDGTGCGLLSWDDVSEDEIAGYRQWSQNEAHEPPPVKASGKDLAYVFYTSGSTGTPKGAMVERAGMRNHLRSKIEALGLSAADVVAQNASHCFDISVWQLLAALMVGGRVVIYGNELVMDPQALVAAVKQDGVSVLEVVPSYMELLLATKGVGEGLGRLKCLVSTAETLSVSLSKRWLERFPEMQLVNAWGPTECSDDVTHEFLSSVPVEGFQRVAIGKPIRGAQVYVLNSALRLVPVGCVGEIAVGGVCVGRGYLGNAVGTATAYVPDPYGRQEGGRLYLTGDMGRWRPDGVLEFFGRRDGQLKVRGRRVEMGEIEGVLGGHPAVSQAVAEMKGGRLVGYWVGEEPIAASDLKKYTGQRLPQHMVPEAFVRLEKLPLNRNGKIDRKALPEPDWAAESEDEFVAPRTDVEQQIAEIWREVLGLERLGIQQNFFDLGGNSLSAMKIVLNLRSRFGDGASIHHLFLNPTVAELAVALNSETAHASAGPIPRLPAQPAYPLAPVQKPMWLAFHEVLTNEIQAWGFPQLLRIEGEVDREVLERALEELIKRHEVLRSSFVEVNGEPGQMIHDDVAIVCPFYDLSSFEDSSQKELLHQFIASQLRATFNNQPPLLRVHLLRLHQRRHLIVLQLLHIVSDMWTERVIVEDLAEIYTSFIEKRAPRLPALPVRYVDYAGWHADRLGSPALIAQKSYWLERFDDIAILERPKPNLEIEARSSENQALLLPNDLMDRLMELAKDRGSTLFAVMLASLSALLARLTGSTDIVVGAAASGRTHPDLEGVVGLFMNPLALRSDASGNPTFLELIERVSHTLLHGLAHQECPFQDWLHQLRLRRRRHDLHPYSIVLSVEEMTQGLRFGEAEASLDHLPGDGFGDDVEIKKRTAGPLPVLRISQAPDGWCAELISGLAGTPLPNALPQKLAGILRQIVETPELRLGDLDLLGSRHFETIDLSPMELEELLA